MPVLLTFDFPPAYGGIQRYAERLARALTDLGQRVEVVAPQTPEAAGYDAALPVPVRRFGGRGGIGRMAGAILATLQAHRAGNDGWTIASSWFPAGLAAAALPRASRGKLLVLAHGSEVAARPRSLRGLLLRWTFSRADCIVANSAFTAERVRSVARTSGVQVIPCGVDDHMIARNPSLTPTILFVGRLVPRKGADRLIETLPLLCAHLGSVDLEIVGSGQDRERLGRLAADCNVAKNVRFLGSVSDEERDAAYARAWCFAMPVRAEGEDVEGFGIVYLEAAMAGLAVIGGSGSGAEDAIADGVTGFVVDGNDSAAIGTALLQLLQDPPRAFAMGEAGRTRARAKFTWKHNAVSIVRTLKEAS